MINDSIKKKIKANSALYGIAKKLKRFFISLSTPTSPKAVTKAVLKYHQKRFEKFSGTFKKSKIKDLSYLTWLYHVIEKGLAMPNMRLGFGYEKIVELDKKISDFTSKYGEKKQALDAIEVLLEYERIHNEVNFKLDPEIQSIFIKWKKLYPSLKPVQQQFITKKELYKDLVNDFPSFMKSRHSIRNFSGEISEEQIIKAIDIARFAPSACNRQPTRVHIISNENLKNKCLALQNGNRGFGNLSSKLLIVTGDLSTIQGGQEFFDLGTNVGIFIMNLSYGLHYNKVAHCILNWYALPKQDIKLRKLTGIPDEETIFAFIVCGDVPEKFKLVASPRISAEEVYTVHK